MKRSDKSARLLLDSSTFLRSGLSSGFYLPLAADSVFYGRTVNFANAATL